MILQRPLRERAEWLDERSAHRGELVLDLPVALVRFTGFAGLAAGVGLVLPAATRIIPSLTPLAAIGLAIIMGLAIPFHIMRGEANAIALHIVVVGFCVFVAWGRFRRVPLRRR